MALPLRLLIGLQMPTSRKVSVAALFCLGFVCIIASTIRVTQISNGSKQPTVPWLALWGTIESAIGKHLTIMHPRYSSSLWELTVILAVIIASGPGLYRIVKMHTSRGKYYANSYPNQISSKTPRSRSKSNGRTTDNEIDLKTYPHASVSRAEPSSSQEGLVYPDGSNGIMVTRAIKVARSEDERST